MLRPATSAASTMPTRILWPGHVEPCRVNTPSIVGIRACHLALSAALALSRGGEPPAYCNCQQGDGEESAFTDTFHEPELAHGATPCWTGSRLPGLSVTVSNRRLHSEPVLPQGGPKIPSSCLMVVSAARKYFSFLVGFFTMGAGCSRLEIIGSRVRYSPISGSIWRPLDGRKNRR